MKPGCLLLFTGERDGNTLWEILRPEPTFYSERDETPTILTEGTLLVFLKKQGEPDGIFYKVLYGDQKGWVGERQVVLFDGEKKA